MSMCICEVVNYSEEKDTYTSFDDDNVKAKLLKLSCAHQARCTSAKDDHPLARNREIEAVWLKATISQDNNIERNISVNVIM